MGLAISSSTPGNIIFEITPSCNFNCIYCYNQKRDNSRSPQKELKLTKIKQLFEKLCSETEVESVTISGGEALLHKDLYEVISFFTSLGLRTGLSTNGSLLTEEIVADLVKAGISYFELSLDSLDPKIHNALTGNRDLDRIKKAVAYIAKSPAVLTISTIISRQNLESISKVIDLSFAFSADYLSLNRFASGGMGEENRHILEIDKSQLISVLDIAEEKSAKLNFPINISLPVEDCQISHSNYPHLNFGTCVCGVNKWVIDPLGNLRICEQNPLILGSLFDNDFDTLSNSEAVLSFREDNFCKSCPDCEKFYQCGGGCRYLRG